MSKKFDLNNAKLGASRIIQALCHTSKIHPIHLMLLLFTLTTYCI